MRPRLERGGVLALRAPDDARRGQIALVDPTLGCDATFGSVCNDVVLIVALTRTRRVLLVRTMAGATPDGLELPAGFVDRDESLPRAATRELYAETGYEGTAARVADLTPCTPHTAGGGAFRVCLVTDARPDMAAVRMARVREIALPTVYAPAFLAALRTPGMRHALAVMRRELDDRR